MIVVIHIATPFDRNPGFGNTQWVHWYRDTPQLWTGYCWQKGKVSRSHHCPVFVGMENGTADGGLRGRIVSVVPRYKGQGEWEWSTHLECDVPPLSDRLGQVKP